MADAYLTLSASTQEDLMTPALGNHKVTMLNISNTLDVQPTLTEKLSHQTSCKRYLLEKIPPNYQMVNFGLDGSRVSQPDLEYLNNKIKERSATANLVWLREAKK